MLSPGPTRLGRMGKSGSRTSGRALRIVAGTLRGSKLAVPDRAGLRPTPDRVRETLFNWLAPHVAGARCLDLYAGTGALGIEALSRGARECVFVEHDRVLCGLLADNLVRLRVAQARVVNEDAAGFLRGPATPFDLVFLDPPFAANLWADSAQRLEHAGWLGATAFVYVECPATSAFALPANWTPHRQGHAGAVAFALYRRVAPDPLS